MSPVVSLVLPALNEVENLEEAVAQARGPLAEIDPDWEIVIVDDGSTDGTGDLAERLADRDGRIRVVHHAENRGLGAAVRSGFEAARGTLLIYADSDLPFDMAALAEAHRVMQATGADLVTGFRTNREVEGPLRHVQSVVYTKLINALLGFPVRDVNFALKLMRREVAEKARLTSDGSFIDAELVARAKEEGFSMVQFGVLYTPRVRGESTLARPGVIVEILRDLTLFRLGRGRRRRQSAALVSA